MDTDVHRKALSAMRIASFFVSAVICVNLRPIKFTVSVKLNPAFYILRVFMGVS